MVARELPIGIPRIYHTPVFGRVIIDVGQNLSKGSNMSKTSDVKIFEWKTLWDAVVETEPNKQTNILYLASLFGASWATANKYVNGNDSIVGFVNENKVQVVVETDTVPADWIPVDTSNPVVDMFSKLRILRDELQDIVNDAMNVVDDANGKIDALDTVLAVIQSEARVEQMGDTIKDLEKRLALAETTNAQYAKELAAQKEWNRMANLSKSSQD